MMNKGSVQEWLMYVQFDSTVHKLLWEGKLSYNLANHSHIHKHFRPR